jgi:hypothetical protein
MASLAFERCSTHAAREAVCRCPLCARYYCRECVTEHEERLVCAACLARVTAAPSHARRGGWVMASLFTLAGFLLTCVCFFGAGQFLVLILTPR